MKMVFTELLGSHDRLKEAFPDDELILFDGPLDKEELIDEAQEAELLSVFIRTPVDEEVIDSLPKLSMINTRSVGFDHIDAKHAAERGITVTHVPEYGPHVVAEHAFCLLLACARNLISADRSVKDEKKFDFHPFMGVELRNKTLGVLGTGKIGRESIRIAQGFGMNVVAFDMYPNEDLAREKGISYHSLEDVLGMSDFVTIHLPLTDDTHGIIGQRALQSMKNGSILVNTARGPILDEDALREAVDSGHLMAAGVDVLSDELHPDEDPLVNSKKIITTPHIGFYTEEAIGRMLDRAIHTITSFQSGELVDKVPMDYSKIVISSGSGAR